MSDYSVLAKKFKKSEGDEDGQKTTSVLMDLSAVTDDQLTMILLRVPGKDLVKICTKLHHGFSYALGKCVAIKITDLSRPNSWVAETRLEVRLLKQLSDAKLDRILNMITAQEKNQQMVMVMELGDTNVQNYWQKFSQENAGNEAALVSEMLNLVKEILLAFDQLHGARIIHLDYKAMNCMISLPEPGQRRGIVKLIDFGGSQEVGEGEYAFFTREPKVQVGSLLYYSPEQRIQGYYKYCGQDQKWVISIKSDIWAIGNVLTEFLTGRAGNEFFFPDLDKKPYVTDGSENYGYVYGRMREAFYPFMVRNWKASRAGLYYIAMACLHADPRLRPTAKELLGFMDDEHELTISSQYQLNVRAPVIAKTYSQVMEEAGAPTLRATGSGKPSLRERSRRNRSSSSRTGK